MSGSKVPALIDYLVATFTSAVTLGQAVSPVTVFDGTVTTAAPPQLVLWVGLTDPDSDQMQPAASFTQARGDLGTATRDETTVIHCCAQAWSGDDTISVQRHAVFAIVAAVEAIVRADNNVGGLGQLAPGVTAGDLLQNNAGPATARVPFTITVRSFT